MWLPMCVMPCAVSEAHSYLTKELDPSFIKSFYNVGYCSRIRRHRNLSRVSR
jgi:hypothetical protein